MADHNEVVFESEICEYLADHGWLCSANDTGYDRERALFPEDLFAWLEETQPAAYAKALRAAGSEAKFLDVVATALDKPLEHGGGTLNILRNGVQYIGGGRLKMAQFRPETSLNVTTNEQYAAMRVRVMRQVHFSTADQRRIDLVFFVNGIPVATVELKTDFTQSLDEAINQYRKDRRPLTNGRPEPLLSFGHRALVHFAVSNDLAAMTTRLEGETTQFLPFNMGHNKGAGNPPGEAGRSATAYLWERVWEKDAWLNIIGRLMIVETKQEWDVETGTSVRRTSMLFPRFHQWEAVTNIVAAVSEEGVGQRYLIEHSAGSGKTNTIAWTAHRLARLHVNDEKVFDSVIVVVDRTVLDGQLQEAIRQIDGSGKIVATISPEDVRKAGAKSKSGLLATALKNGELIIAVTVQTFPFALDEIRVDKGLKSKRFAVIADEAHSSQSGQISSKLKAVLTAEEVKAIEEGGSVDVEAILASEMTERAESESISYFAFTATPKNKTLELFGRKGPDGKPVEFHLYSMRQAIEEGYILDVLRGYQSYDTALKIAGQAESGDGDEVVEEAAARKGLMRWVKLHPTNIGRKVQIIVEHFHANVAHLLEGKAKAMVVTDSRKAAVKYKKAIDAYIAKRATTDPSYNYRTLVAFSGSVTMAEDEEWASDWGPQPSKDDEFTEANLNPGAGSDLAAAFKGATYKIMLVANKYQTGFDQPLLSAMYIDKKLSGVAAVQTLSRLNRTHRTTGGEQKRKTFVIDFVNKPEDIRTAFEPYFTNATLETETDPYIVIHLATKLAQAGIYTPEQVRDVARLWVERRGNNALSAAISPAKNEFARRYTAAIEADDKVTLNTLDLFRKDVSTLVRLYDFMSQIIDYGDPHMEMLSIFLRLLEKVIADSSWAAEVDLSDVVLVGVKHNKGTAVDISLTGDGELKGISTAGTGTRKEPKYVALQVVIDKMNDLFGAESFAESQVREFVQGLVQRLLAYPELVNQTKVNSKKQFMESQDFQAAVTEAVVDNQEAHNTMADYFFSDGPGINSVIMALADAFYETAIDQPPDVPSGSAPVDPRPSGNKVAGRPDPLPASTGADPYGTVHRRDDDLLINRLESASERSERFLVAQLPARSPMDAEVSLVVQIPVRPPDWSVAQTPIPGWSVPAEGARVSVLVHASAGLLSVTAQEQSVVVPGNGDSAPLRFGFRTRAPGLHKVRVMAFAGGTFLAELELEISVEPGGPSVDGQPVTATMKDLQARHGEVTLQVRSDGERTMFQLLSDAYLFEPVPAEALAGEAPAVERVVATLRRFAAGQGPYGPDLARRWMQETGIGLWDDVVPAVIKDQYWQLRDHITSFTIATSRDVIPWELLYPLKRGANDGFLIEQFPVLRRVFDQQRSHRVKISPCTYVVSDHAPANAQQEIDALAATLGNAGTVQNLDELLTLLSSECGPLHFACHNSFSSEAGSSIAMSGGPFVPELLNSATINRSLAPASPLVFLNACRTAGAIAEYHQMTGWAQQFMAAGAGAFVGTLWPVRSDSASTFAQTFYRLLDDGEPLGQAALQSRRSAVRDGPDPTWLAYTVYGDPYATTL